MDKDEFTEKASQHIDKKVRVHLSASDDEYKPEGIVRTLCGWCVDGHHALNAVVRNPHTNNVSLRLIHYSRIAFDVEESITEKEARE